MFVPYHEVDALEATRNNAPELTAQVASGDLSIFALHHAGSSYEEALDLVAPTLRDSEFIIERPLELRTDDETQAARDEVWHTDRLPSLNRPEVSRINIHYTRQGAGEGRFVEPTLAYAHHTAANHGTDFKVIRSALERGEVNPEFFATQCIKAVLRPETMVVFRATGQRPMVHLFSTTKFVRIAQLGIARHRLVDLFI